MNEQTDNEKELQEFDLEDILNEFHDDAQNGQESADSEPDMSEILGMPPLTVDGQENASLAGLNLSLNMEEPALEGNTVRFSPITEEQLSEDLLSREPLPDAPVEEAAIPAAEEDVPADGGEEPSAQAQAAAAEPEPAFEVEEEFIPTPDLFTNRSRLRELKKKLVTGPEKRYYELSEVGTGKLQIAILLSVLITALSAGVALAFAAGAIPGGRLKFVIFSQVLCMMLSALLGIHLIMDSIAALFRGRFTVNTLITITFAVCMADAVFCLREQRIPCCAAFSLGMTMALWARLEQRNTELAQLDTMRKAVRLHGLVRVADYFNGQDGLLRTEGEVEDFMDVYDRMSGPQIGQSIYAGLSLVACIAIAVFAGLRSGISMALQILSTSLLVAAPATLFISLTRPMAILQQRLHMVGTVLCGWQGVKELKGKLALPLYDQDLFPQGSVKLNGVKFYGDEEPVDVVSYTASLISVAGGGLMPVFRNLLVGRNGTLYPVSSFQRYSGGGIGGEVQGLPVLLGSLNFLQDMGVDIPEGTMVSQAVYAAIDGQLSGVYAISYAKMRSSAAGLVTLCGSRKVTPVMLCSDFMLTESFLGAKFNVKTRRMAFPDKEECVKLSRVRPDPELPVLALTTREELVSTAYAISGARALRTACRLGLVIHMLGGILGMVIMLALAVLGNTELLTPANILLYQLIWGLPGLLVTEWTRII